MSTTDYTDEALTGFEINEEGATEPSHNTSPKAPQNAGYTATENSIRQALAKERDTFRSMLDTLRRLPACSRLAENYEAVRRQGQRVEAVQSIASRKHWQEFADPEENTTLRFW